VAEVQSHSTGIDSQVRLPAATGTGFSEMSNACQESMGTETFLNRTLLSPVYIELVALPTSSSRAE
jgi:hypothetical protein